MRPATDKEAGQFGWTYILSTGTLLSASNLIVGIAPDLEVSDGYDGCLRAVNRKPRSEDEYRYTLSPEERKELADYMIDLWTQYRDKK